MGCSSVQARPVAPTVVLPEWPAVAMGIRERASKTYGTDTRHQRGAQGPPPTATAMASTFSCIMTAANPRRKAGCLTWGMAPEIGAATNARELESVRKRGCRRRHNPRPTTLLCGSDIAGSTQRLHADPLAILEHATPSGVRPIRQICDERYVGKFGGYPRRKLKRSSGNAMHRSFGQSHHRVPPRSSANSGHWR